MIEEISENYSQGYIELSENESFRTCGNEDPCGGEGLMDLLSLVRNLFHSTTWSPDGEKIAFTSDRDGNEEIYVMNADGSNQKNLTNNPCNDRDPDWCCHSFIEPSLINPPFVTEEPSPTGEYTTIVIAVIILVVVLFTFVSHKKRKSQCLKLK